MRISRRSFLTTSACAPFFARAVLQAGGAEAATALVVYLGTYTGTTSKGIYAWRFDSSTGKLTPAGLAAESANPSFLSLHPSRPVLYAVNELSSVGSEKTGTVSAFAIDAGTGRLTPLNRVMSRGLNPAHLTVDPTGRWVLIANYGGSVEEGSSVAVFGIRPDGGLNETPQAFVAHPGVGEQKVAHPHQVVLAPDNRFLLVPDKGADRIVQYRWDPRTGALTANDPPFVSAPAPGAGPRHLTFDRSGRFVYAAHELSSTVTTYGYAAGRGTLTPIETISTLPKDSTVRNTTAEIEVHPTGKFLYVSNRGLDTIALFAIDAKTGTLALVGQTPTGGRTPRHFKIDPSGAYLFAANQNSDKTLVFKIDGKTGQLSPTAEVLDTPSPVCVVFR